MAGGRSGTRGLSIIGLNNGEQPMTSPDGDVHLVVNGEFYGYREIRDRCAQAATVHDRER